MKRTTTLAVAGALLLSGCLFGPTIDCDDSGWEGGPTCAAVLEVARRELSGTSGITKISALEGIHCSEAPEWCPATFVVTVFADLFDGGQLVVIVRLQEDGRLLTNPLERVVDDDIDLITER
jgi:hypothetical protein